MQISFRELVDKLGYRVRPAGRTDISQFELRVVLWSVPVLIMALEVVAALVNPLLAVVLYAALAIALYLGIGANPDDGSSHMRVLGYALIAFVAVRLVSLCMYYAPIPRLSSMLAVTISSAIAVGSALRYCALESPHRPAQSQPVMPTLWLQLGGIALGVFFGALYLAFGHAGILAAGDGVQQAITSGLSSTVWLTLGALVVFGVFEELLFRGLMQRALTPYLGIGAVVLVALAHSLIFVGQLAPALVLFTFVTGICFGLLTHVGSSATGAALGRGLFNAFLMPQMLGLSGSVIQGIALAACAALCALSLLALWQLQKRASWHPRRVNAAEQSDGSQPQPATPLLTGGDS